MYQIDLLKGKKAKSRSNFSRILFVGLGIILPVLAFLAFGGEFIRNKIIIDNKVLKIKSLDNRLSKLSHELQYYEEFAQKVNGAKDLVKDITKALKRNTQWSNTLIEITNNLPGNIIIKEMEVISTEVKNKPDKNNPDKLKSTIKRTLKLTVCGEKSMESDEAVKLYIDNLRKSEYLSQKIEEINLSAKKEDEIDSRSFASYEIDMPIKIKD